MNTPYQFPLFLPRSPLPDTPDPKLVWKAYQHAAAMNDREEAERLLERWRSLQPRTKTEVQQ